MRIHVINRTYHNVERFPPKVVREICYLQFRFLCETVALGCLVIHDGIKKTERLQSTYKAGNMIDAMEAQKPHFYPQPMEVSKRDGTFLFSARNDKLHLTKKDLGKLWSVAGGVVHRGSFSKLAKPEGMVASLKAIPSTPDNFRDIFDWSAKITGLLNCHWLTLVDNKRGVVVDLLTDTGRSKATIMDFDVSDPSRLSVVVEAFQFQPDH